MRLTVLDGFRGYFLLFMMVAHAAGTLGAPIGLLSHHSLGWVEDAQGFVFVSGLVVGMVYGKRMIRKGYGTMRDGIWKRIGKIYRYQAAMILGFLLLALLCRALMDEVPQALQSYGNEPVVFTAISLLLVGSSMHMGILPMYIAFMLLTPVALWLFSRGQAGVVLIVSGVAWLVSQLLIFDALQYPVENMLAAIGHPVNLGIYFDVTGWQLLFFVGLYAGWLTASDRLDLTQLRRTEVYPVFVAGVVAFAGFAIFDWAVMAGWPSDEIARRLTGDDRAMLAPIYVIAFFLDLFLITWLLVAGKGAENRVVRAAASGLEWLMTRPALTLLGRHSLEVFVAHVVVAYALAIWAEGRSFGTTTANLLVLASLIPLFVVAWAKDAPKRREAAAARPA